MELTIIYRPQSEHARLTEEFMHDFSRLHPDMSLKTLDADSVEGVHKLEVYGLYQTPALAVTRSSSGDVIKIWSGDSLPLMDEVAGYMRS